MLATCPVTWTAWSCMQSNSVEMLHAVNAAVIIIIIIIIIIVIVVVGSYFILIVFFNNNNNNNNNNNRKSEISVYISSRQLVSLLILSTSCGWCHLLGATAINAVPPHTYFIFVLYLCTLSLYFFYTNEWVESCTFYCYCWILRRDISPKMQRKESINK